MARVSASHSEESVEVTSPQVSSSSASSESVDIINRPDNIARGLRIARFLGVG